MPARLWGDLRSSRIAASLCAMNPEIAALKQDTQQKQVVRIWAPDHFGYPTLDPLHRLQYVIKCSQYLTTMSGIVSGCRLNCEVCSCRGVRIHPRGDRKSTIPWLICPSMLLTSVRWIFNEAVRHRCHHHVTLIIRIGQWVLPVERIGLLHTQILLQKAPTAIVQTLIFFRHINSSPCRAVYELYCYKYIYIYIYTKIHTYI